MRILLAEDDARLSDRIKEDLVRRGYAVDVADNGVDAEYYGNEGSYDAVILDLGLPQRSGLDVLRNWRERGNPMPVLILTARDAWHEKVEGFNAGADDYVAKPFHVEELYARAWRTDPARPRPARGGGDRRRIAARRGAPGGHLRRPDDCAVGHRIPPAPLFHAAPRARCCPRSHLAEHVYDNDSDRDSNVIEVHVNHLRNKIGAALIKTRRGQGYVFGASS